MHKKLFSAVVKPLLLLEEKSGKMASAWSDVNPKKWLQRFIKMIIVKNAQFNAVTMP